MTAKDVLTYVPDNLGYVRTDRLCWFVSQARPIDEPKHVLAQQWVSTYCDVPSIWVAIQEVELPSDFTDY